MTNENQQSNVLLRGFILGGALLALGACEDGGSSEGTDAGGGATHDHDHDHDAEPEPAEPQYVLHTAVQAPDGDRTNYFTVVASLGEERELDYKQSLEVPGRARLYAEPGIGHFAIGDGEDVSITRYELAEDGSFEPGDSISLQSFGVASMGAQAVLFTSPTKAYYKDDTQAQIIVWNPQEMLIEKSIDLPAELIREGRVTSLSSWVHREGEAYIAVGWSTETYDQVDPGLALVRIDTETDEVAVSEDSRCRGVYKTAKYEDTLYFFSGVINGFGYAVHGDDGGQQDCILRILPGEEEFDPDYLASVAHALSDEEIGTGIDVTSDGRVWYQVVDTSAVNTDPGATYGEWYATGWTWEHFDLETLSDRVTALDEAGAYAGVAFVVGDDFFISQTAADYSETTLVNLSGGEPAPGLSFPGFTLDVAQVR